MHSKFALIVPFVFLIAFLLFPPGAEARTMEFEIVLNAPLQESWDLFTTKEGVESWMVPVAEVDWRVGGTLRTHYNAKAKIGDPGTTTHHILAYEPLKMYASRFEAPANAPTAKIAEQTWGIARFQPVSDTRTRIVFSSLGWQEGGVWDEAWEFFEKGNQWTFEQLLKKYPGSEVVESIPGEADLVLDRIAHLVGGEWIHEGTAPGGGPFLVRNQVEHGPDGRSLFGKGWLGNESGMFLHGYTQVWKNHERDRVEFVNVNENGEVASGEIRPDGEHAVIWHWASKSQEGGMKYYRIRHDYSARDSYTMQMFDAEPGSGFRSIMEIEFRRVRRTPKKFLRMQKDAG